MSIEDLDKKQKPISYNDLLDKPTIPSGSYTDLTDKPTLFDGDYDSLSNKPSTFPSDWNDVANKPTSFGLEAGDILKTYRSAPSGYLACDGGIYLQSAYSNLYNAIGLIGDYYNWSSGGSSIFGHSTRDIYTIGSHNSLIISAGYQGYLATSNDGKGGWTLRTSQFGTTHIRNFASSGTKVVAVGDTGKISVSTDGFSWTAKTSGTASNILDVIYIDGKFFCYGQFNGYISSIDDGETWTYNAVTGTFSESKSNTVLVAFDKIFRFRGNFFRTANIDMTSLSSDTNLSSLVTISNTPRDAYFDGTTLVVIYNGKQIIKTTDGVNFSSVSNNPFLVGSQILNTVRKIGDYWFVGDNGGNYSITDDLSNWSPLSNSNGVISNDSITTATELIVVGRYGIVKWIEEFVGYDGTTSFQVPTLNENDFIKI